MQTTNEAFVAFFSYDRHNDERDRGNLTRLRKLLQTEVLVQSGKPIIKIFQDQENIEWGEAWKERIKKVLNESLMLIAVVTPSYLESASCRFELEYFLKQNTRLEQKLILPILYIDTPKLSDTKDFVAVEISKREWIDWKDLRFASLTSAKVNKRIEFLAKQIHNFMVKQENINKHRANVSIPMPPPPDNFPNRWDDEWQPFFELVNATENTKLTDKKILPPPALYVPLAKEEGTTNSPKQITLTLRSTGDKEHDKRRIKTLYGTLISFHGHDRFSFLIPPGKDGKGHLIDFPDDTTRVDTELLSRLKKLLGEEIWQISEFKPE